MGIQPVQPFRDRQPPVNTTASKLAWRLRLKRHPFRIELLHFVKEKEVRDGKHCHGNIPMPKKILSLAVGFPLPCK
jgi:hypothetical protein